MGAVKETEETEGVGDDSTKELIKSLPKLSLLKLKETAEDCGIDVPDGAKKSWLIKNIVAKLKGK